MIHTNMYFSTHNMPSLTTICHTAVCLSVCLSVSDSVSLCHPLFLPLHTALYAITCRQLVKQKTCVDEIEGFNAEAVGYVLRRAVYKFSLSLRLLRPSQQQIFVAVPVTSHARRSAFSVILTDLTTKTCVSSLSFNTREFRRDAMHARACSLAIEREGER